MNPFKLKLPLPTGSFLFRLIAANTVVFVLSLLILSIVNYTFTNMISEKQISETHRKLLNQTDANIETLYERVFQIGEQLLNDKDVIKSLYSTRIDPVDSLVLDRKLHDIVNANDFINSVYLYNGATGRFIHSIPQDVNIVDIDPEARHLVQVRNGLAKMIFLPHKQQYVYSNKKYDNPILSLIFNPSDARSEYAIFINLKLSSLQELIDKMGNPPDSTFLITNKNGILITRSDRPDSFLDAASRFEFMDKVIKSDRKSDSFVDTMNGSKSLVTYVYNDKLEWYLVNTTRYAYLTKESFILQRNIIIVSLLILLICLIATILMNRRIYGPMGNVIRMVRGNDPLQASGGAGDEAAYLSDVFKNLIGRVTSLEDSAVRDRKKLKESLLKDILLSEGNARDIDYDHLFEHHGLKFNREPMRVLAVILEGIEQREEASQDNGINLVKDTVFELALHVFHERDEMEKVDMGHHSFVLIMNEPPDHGLIERLNVFIHQVEKVTGLRLMVGVGSRGETIPELSQSLGTAREALAYRFVDSRRIIYDYDTIQAQLKTPFRYPVKLERTLFESLKLNDKRGAKRIVDEWFNELRGYTVSDIRAALRQSAITIESELGTMVDFTRLISVYDRHSLEGVVSALPTLERIEAFYSELADFTIEQLKMKRHRESGVIVNQACEYIQSHYKNSGLSADSVAAVLNISVPYFSKLFNEAMGVSFTQYVTELRLNEAENLLLATTLNVKEIGERIGFQNSSYFITVFKKKCGASPNQFRQLKKAE
ncbi:AraC family transcriptional regulator [Paenibacillus dokdonensis]|uniref:AraC family transcriptional regulator n=1 Tax=Paenibacillus dokdonensis TaxID=2567944 RepID=UPI0010A86A98|nr:helix-turn-helix domain-containing protein [Paenibacillus dokdonensis]